MSNFFQGVAGFLAATVVMALNLFVFVIFIKWVFG